MYRSRSRWPVAALGFVAAGVLFATACTPQTMTDQPRYDTYAASGFFADNGAARPLVDDTVARGSDKVDGYRATGQNPDGTFVNAFPAPVTREMLDNGQQKFNTFCSPCHGYRGNGGGLVAQRGFSGVVSLNQDRLRSIEVGYLYNVVTNGKGVMPPYGHLMPVDDRWALVAYVRALQLSQNATINDVPPDQRAQLQSGGGSQ